MRTTIPVLCLLLCGCSSRVTQEEVTDSTGSNRLSRVDRKIGSVMDALQSRQSFDFDSLASRHDALVGVGRRVFSDEPCVAEPDRCTEPPIALGSGALEFWNFDKSRLG